MLDLLDFQVDKGGDLKKLKESQRRRFAPESLIDDILFLFEDHKKTNYEVTRIKSQANEVQKEIGQIKRNKGDATELLAQKVTLEKQAKQLNDSASEKQALLFKKLKMVGNYVHDTVPISDNEDNNQKIRSWQPDGVAVEKKDCLSHHEVLTRIGGYDPERGVKVAGHRGYALTGYGLFLNLALINYGLEFLFGKGYTPNQPPYFMLKDAMSKTAQLEQFDEELYKVSEGEGKEKDDKYLIATSEQPISALHEAEWLQDKDLPIKYAGYSTCFRKEAGSHGKDAWGIFRVHQFEKIEQFLFTKPEDSWKHFDEMIATAEEFYQSLQIPYQVVAIVSGALNNAASKKFDLEAWFPYQGEYKELVSCSNCTDYQARALEIRYGPKVLTDSKKKYVHALNSTLCATERALCCILENYQTETGVRVPEVLRRFIPGQPEEIPFIRDLPKDSTSNKAKAKAKAKTITKPTDLGANASAAVNAAAGVAKDNVQDAVDAVTSKIQNLKS